LAAKKKPLHRVINYQDNRSQRVTLLGSFYRSMDMLMQFSDGLVIL
jgi:hypothetical protein